MKIKQRTARMDMLDLLKELRGMVLYHEHTWGTALLTAALLVTAVLCSLRLDKAPAVYMAGEIAASDVIADHDIMVQDDTATKTRRDQLSAIQPVIFDLDHESAVRVREDILLLLHSLNTASVEGDAFEKLAADFNSRHGTDVSSSGMRTLAGKEAQEYVFDTLLPWLDSRLAEGILPDMRLLSAGQTALIIRDASTGNESLRTIDGTILDLRALSVALGQKIREESKLRRQTQSALLEVLPVMLMPTLAVNQNATAQRTSDVLRTLPPVYYRIQKGEVLVRAGDTVTFEQQLKMQALFSKPAGIVNPVQALGIFIMSMVLGLGFFTTPNMRKSTRLKNKDQCLVAVLILLFGIAAVGVNYLGFQLSGTIDPGFLPYMFPVAGGVGLSVLVFSARRFCVISLLIAYFTTLIFHGGVLLFSFYFLSSMVITWIVTKAHNREDISWGSLPFFLWNLMLEACLALHSQIPLAEIPYAAFSAFIYTFLSTLILFAFSPLIEIAFGYTTRFRLMELMSLDQPLLRDLQLKLPGTYHHSVVVSNLAEAGAKAIGANSLLAKTAGLYHDIGKEMRPTYFTENQENGINPHNSLAPSMSCLILFAHVKQGAELAQANKLGSEITDIIRQHHGTRAPGYFYKKAVEIAKEKGENPPSIEAFRYPGPKPQTKEAALIMLADAVEASCRSIKDASPARLTSNVQAIVREIYEEGQLDDADLTFRDMTKICDIFSQSLIGLYHQRISYTDIKTPGAAKAAEADDAAENEAAGPEASPGPAPEGQAQAKLPAAEASGGEERNAREAGKTPAAPRAAEDRPLEAEGKTSAKADPGEQSEAALLSMTAASPSDHPGKNSGAPSPAPEGSSGKTGKAPAEQPTAADDRSFLRMDGAGGEQRW